MTQSSHMFESEERAISRAEEVLKASHDQKVDLGDYQDMVSEYHKLFRQTKRLIRFNDKSEARLSEMNSQWQGLSQKLSKYLPIQIYNSIFSGEKDASISSSRKKLTIFFSDIVGFTETTESLTPEDLTTLLNFYLGRMFAIAEKHGGTIDKSIGDAIMVFFGDPSSDGAEGDALRCTQMAIEMREALNVMQKELHHIGVTRPFKARMGITTGYVTVGNFGGEQRMDYTIIGSHVNLASRLESQAERDQILISHETYGLIRDKVLCRKKESLRVKGFPYPIQTYEVIDQLDRIEEQDDITASVEGFSVYVDRKCLTPASAEIAKNVLRKLLDELE